MIRGKLGPHPVSNSESDGWPMRLIRDIVAGPVGINLLSHLLSVRYSCCHLLLRKTDGYVAVTEYWYGTEELLGIAGILHRQGVSAHKENDSTEGGRDSLETSHVIFLWVDFSLINTGLSFMFNSDTYTNTSLFLRSCSQINRFLNNHY